MKLHTSPPEIQDCLHKKLQQYNANYMTGFKDYSLHIEEDGAVVAGIVAGSVGDTLEVEFLFVDDAVRGRHLGAALLSEAEHRAKADGIKRVLLNTYSFQAPGFYRKMGYHQLFALHPCFDSYSQHFFIKEL
ncbi:GNAT family N-acetyltransferase [Pseudoflavonifractor sp. 524-17]|uniref:GNAT family N-acetyltransferase n=1 Tax=Pseudoflavonifractor sp. 524-17 TaxID=2304577 RepID=UPI001379BC68|nr:GNAT family N-acetyltransferase [Pseudoflavonifractor sp. 524-17]NCE63127.1 GNAT family N-acetyltransferase [Pseudoflavonifractor sp. 524-17]